MRAIDKKFLISALIFIVSCMVYAAVLRITLQSHGPQITADLGMGELPTLVLIDLLQNLYWCGCSIFFGILISQWIINQPPVNKPARAITLTKSTQP